jgi:hypothetical protein
LVFLNKFRFGYFFYKNRTEPKMITLNGEDAEMFRSLPWKQGFCHQTTHHMLLDEDIPLTNHANNLAKAFFEQIGRS